MGLPEAFYERDGEDFIATELTRGPWDEGAQHGGPPAALLGRALETWGDDAVSRPVVRFTMELLRPIPLGRMTVRVEPTRTGRRADWLTGILTADGREVARASAVRIATNDVELPGPHCPPHDAPAGPEEIEPFVFPFFTASIAYHRAVDIRFVEGRWGGFGPIKAWLKLTTALVAGEPTTPLQQTLSLADAQNGLCVATNPLTHVFVNPDLTVHLRRPMTGAWVGLAVRSTAEPNGIGLCQSELFDAQGEVGRVLQSLVVSQR